MERFLKSRYRIGKQIGESPYSLTYKGTFLANDTPLIIKIYKRAALNSTLIQSMKEKVREFASITHPNIARLYDGDYGWQGFYYVREYVAGQNLKELLALKGRLDVSYSVSLISSVIAALTEAARRGIIHAGLKPANIFINQKGQVKVTDFVIQGEIKDSLPQKAQDVLSGQPYLSPEEALGMAADFRSDLFMLGAVFYEMLSGEPYRQTARRFKVIKEVPKYINDILYKVLEEDPLLRFNSLDEIDEALKKKLVAEKKSRFEVPRIELEDEEQPEVAQMKVVKAERSRSFQLLFVVLLAIIAGIAYALFSTMRF